MERELATLYARHGLRHNPLGVRWVRHRAPTHAYIMPRQGRPDRVVLGARRAPRAGEHVVALLEGIETKTKASFSAPFFFCE